MNRLLRMPLFALLALSALLISAQEKSAFRADDLQKNNSQKDDPQRIERIAPPSPTASAHELEVSGDILRAKKEYLDAVDYYRAAMQKAESAVLHNKIGICMIQLQRYSDSKREFEKAVKADGNYAEAHNNLGAADYQLRRFGAAVKEYNRAIKLNDLSAHFHSNLGSAYFSRKEFSKAISEYRRALELDPTIFDPQAGGGVSVKLATQSDSAFFHYLIAKMYGMKGDEEHCRLYLAKAYEAGYPYVRDALKDGEFAELRKDPGFVVFVRSLKKSEE